MNAPAVQDATPPDPRDEIVTHVKAMRAFALSLTRDLSSADDLVQDTIVKAWSNIDKFQPGTNMRAWLFTILRNTFYSDRRRAKRIVSDSDGVMTDAIAVKPDHDGHLAMVDFRRAFEELSDEQREALILVGAQGISCEEAAQMCGCAVGTIKSRVNRGRRRLTEVLQLDVSEASELTDSATLAVIARNPGIG